MKHWISTALVLIVASLQAHATDDLSEIKSCLDVFSLAVPQSFMPHKVLSRAEDPEKAILAASAQGILNIGHPLAGNPFIQASTRDAAKGLENAGLPKEKIKELIRERIRIHLAIAEAMGIGRKPETELKRLLALLSPRAKTDRDISKRWSLDQIKETYQSAFDFKPHGFEEGTFDQFLRNFRGRILSNQSDVDLLAKLNSGYKMDLANYRTDLESSLFTLARYGLFDEINQMIEVELALGNYSTVITTLLRSNPTLIPNRDSVLSATGFLALSDFFLGLRGNPAYDRRNLDAAILAFGSTDRSARKDLSALLLDVAQTLMEPSFQTLTLARQSSFPNLLGAEYTYIYALRAARYSGDLSGRKYIYPDSASVDLETKIARSAASAQAVSFISSLAGQIVNNSGFWFDTRLEAAKALMAINDQIADPKLREAIQKLGT